jgi:hypothetical protein
MSPKTLIVDSGSFVSGFLNMEKTPLKCNSRVSLKWQDVNSSVMLARVLTTIINTIISER